MWTLNIKQLDEKTRDDLLVAFQNAGESIEIGDAGEDVQVIEQLLEDIDPNFYNGPPDDEFGKGVRKAVLRFQESRLLEEDGCVGPKTRHELVLAWRTGWHPGQVFKLTLGDHAIPTFGTNHPRLGKLPGTVLGRVEGGKVSNFGGPHDPGDRIYGQAYLTGAKTPREFIDKHRNLVAMGVVMDEATALAVETKGFKPFFNEGLDRWPLTTDWRGRVKHAGTSSLLNPNGCYCAIRRTPAQRHRRNEKCPIVLVWNPENGKAAAALNTDYGPATFTGKIIDVSPGIEWHLGLRTGGYVRVAWGLDGDTPRLIG